MSIWTKIEQDIALSLGSSFKVKTQSAVSGGDINQAYRIDGVLGTNQALSFFIKLNQKNRLSMFQAEAAGLQEIALSQTINTPDVVCTGIAEQKSYLILENLTLSAGQPASAAQFGQQLANMHKHISPKQNFGWSQDNTIGATPQFNTQTGSWVDFWREQRLGFQLDLAQKNGANHALIRKGEKLLAHLDSFFTDYKPQASLLHGDLWSGNYGYLETGDPVIFDPAVYYGDRETDLAMTEMFGGFPVEFYTAYNDTWPLDEGYKRRKVLYNLYHVLNHFNLFSGGYAMQAENMIDKLVSLN